jgi:hypothetical protein
MRILDDVHAVIDIDEKEMIRLRIKDEDHSYEEKREDESSLFRRSE